MKNKFLDDLAGAEKNDAQGFAFLTNQHMTVGERESLVEAAGDIAVDIFHLERIARILDAPMNYGVRLEFLDIEMSKEEQLAYYASITQGMDEVREMIRAGLAEVKGPEIDVEKLKEFKSILGTIVDMPGSFSIFVSPMSRLHVPLTELREFQALLKEIIGDISSYHVGSLFPPPISRLMVPLQELQEYEATLDRILKKQQNLGDFRG